MGVWLRFVRYDANVVLRTEGLPRHRRTRHPPAGRETLVCIRRERVGFTKNTAMRHRRGGKDRDGHRDGGGKPRLWPFSDFTSSSFLMLGIF